MRSDPPDATRPEPTGRPWSPRRIFWISWVLFFAAAALWSLANPLMAAPDEPAHTIKAAAVVRGQFLGDQQVDRIGAGLVEVPALFARTAGHARCFAFHPEVPADCAPAFEGDLTTPTTALTSAVRYNPLYYLVAGAPSLLPVGVASLYLMRLAGAVVAGLLLASTWRTVAEIPRSHPWVLALAAATTPMVVFFTSVINPQSWEIPAALLVWTSALALGRSADPALVGRRLTRLTLGAVVLAETRSLGPLFVGGILLVVVLLSPAGTLRALLRDHRAWWAVAVTVAAVVASGCWILLTGTLDTGPAVVRYPAFDGWGGFRAGVDATPGYLRDMLGLFGWTEHLLPRWWYLVAAGTPLAVWFAGTLLGRTRDRLAMAGILTVVVVLPIVAQAHEARYINLFWQGRYLLPAAVGVLLVAGAVLHHRDRPRSPAIRTGTLAAGAVLVAVGQVAGFVLNLDRYRDRAAIAAGGTGTGWLPVPEPWLIGGTAGCWLCLTALALATADSRPGRAPRATEVPVEPAVSRR